MARSIGAVSKFKRAVLERCEASGVNPIDVLIEFCKQGDYRFHAAKELAGYCYPKLQSMQFTLEDIEDEVLEKECERRIHLRILNGQKSG